MSRIVAIYVPTHGHQQWLLLATVGSYKHIHVGVHNNHYTDIMNMVPTCRHSSLSLTTSHNLGIHSTGP